MPMEIRFEQVEKWFGKKNVLHNLDWTLHPGDTWRIEGPSGVGKTTLLRLMMGLEHPTRGTIQGTDALRFAPVFQENRLVPRLNAVQNLRLTCGLPTKEIETTLCEVLDEADLNQPAETLSGGMQRRVSIVRALLAPSDVLVLDEPFSGLDAENRERSIRCIDRRRNGRTLVFVSHEPIDSFSAANCLHLD